MVFGAKGKSVGNFKEDIHGAVCRNGLYQILEKEKKRCLSVTYKHHGRPQIQDRWRRQTHLECS